MKKAKILGLGGAMGLLVLSVSFFASPASADEHSVITFEPSYVEATTGSVTVTVTGVGFDQDADTAAYASPCPGAKADISAVTATTAQEFCPTLVSPSGILGSGTPITGGSFSLELTLDITQDDIDAGGIVIQTGIAGDFAQAGTTASSVLEIGGMMDDELAAGGAETAIPALIGGSVIVAGLLMAGLGRRMRSRSKA